MNNNINKKLEDILKKINPQDLKKLASTPGIQNVIRNLSDSDRQKLISEFSTLSSDEISRKLNSKNLGSLQGMSAEQIIKKIRSL